MTGKPSIQIGGDTLIIVIDPVFMSLHLYRDCQIFKSISQNSDLQIVQKQAFVVGCCGICWFHLSAPLQRGNQDALKDPCLGDNTGHHVVGEKVRQTEHATVTFRKSVSARFIPQTLQNTKNKLTLRKKTSTKNGSYALHKTRVCVRDHANRDMEAG